MLQLHDSRGVFFDVPHAVSCASVLAMIRTRTLCDDTNIKIAAVSLLFLEVHAKRGTGSS